MSASVCGDWTGDFLCNANYLAPLLTAVITAIYTVFTGAMIWLTVASNRRIILEQQRLQRLQLRLELQRGWNSIEMLECRITPTF